jgi:hypothetical protein
VNRLKILNMTGTASQCLEGGSPYPDGETLDIFDFIARVLTQIPQPRDSLLWDLCLTSGRFSYSSHESSHRSHSRGIHYFGIYA